MWSILSMIFCAIILSENYYFENFQNLLTIGGNGPAASTSSSARLMVMVAAATDPIESRIHKRGEFNTFQIYRYWIRYGNMIRIWRKYFIQFAATFALTQSNSRMSDVMWWYTYSRRYLICLQIDVMSNTHIYIYIDLWLYMRICPMAINSIFPSSKCESV